MACMYIHTYVCTYIHSIYKLLYQYELYMYVCVIVVLHTTYFRKTAFKGKHNLVHLNLCVALLLALIVFVSGIETATESEVSLILLLIDMYV